MRRGDGPILFALIGVAIVTVAVRPPEESESTDDGSREVPSVTARSTPSSAHASPESTRVASARYAAASPVPSLVAPAQRPSPTAAEPSAWLDERPIAARMAPPHDRDLGGAFAADGRVTLVALSASWCVPCARELPELIALGAALRAEVNARLVLVMVDEVGGPLGLDAAVDELWAKAEPTSRARPPWLELRADPDAHWARWAGDREGRVPQTLLLGPAGELRARVAGPLVAAHAERLTQLALALTAQGAP